MNITAPMVGRLVSLEVKAGDPVRKNDVVAVIEAMKMMVKVYSPVEGLVKNIQASPGDVVNPDTVIVELE